MLTGIAVLLYILFSDSAGGKKLFSGRQEGVICAIPSNAVAVAKFGSLRDLSTWVLSKQVPAKGPKGRKIPFEKTLADSVLSGAFPYLSKSVAAVSFHYANELIPLYVFDAGRSGDSDYDDEIAKLSSIASAAGYVHKDCDCSTILSVNPILRKRRILLVSPSVNIVNSSLRHLNDNVSIYDHDAFAQAASAVSADNCLYLDVTCAEQISKEVLDKKFRGHSKIISGFSDWAAFSMDFPQTSARFSGTVVSDMDTDLVRVFSGLQESSSTVCEMLPSTTVWALSIPLDSVDDFSEAFDLYLDSRMKLSDARKLRKIIGKKTGTDPLQWFKSLNPEELEGKQEIAVHHDDPPPEDIAQKLVDLVDGEQPMAKGVFVERVKTTYGIMAKTAKLAVEIAINNGSIRCGRVMGQPKGLQATKFITLPSGENDEK